MRAAAAMVMGMTTGPRHPHTAMPTREELRTVIDAVQPQHTDLCLAVHALILAALPEVRYQVDRVDGAIGYGARQFGYGGWGMASLQAHKGWVALHFMQGAKLPDPDGNLEGAGAQLRHVKLRSQGELSVHATAIQALAIAARQLFEA
jgi:hypothetical protein